jgi:hypothetical protein
MFTYLTAACRGMVGRTYARAAWAESLMRHHANLALKFLLLPAAGVGDLLIAIAKLNRVEGE